LARSSPWWATSSPNRSSAFSCSVVEYGPARPEGDRRVRTELRAALDHGGQLGLVNRDQLDAELGQRLVDLPGTQLEVLLREGQRPQQRSATDLVASDDREVGDRLAVLVAQLLERALTAREQRPPNRLGLAPVVADQVEGHPERTLRGGVLGLVVGKAGE
jgi:hypothetical protein